MSQQVRGLIVIHSHIVVTKSPGEKVVDLPCDIEDVANPKNETLSLSFRVYHTAERIHAEMFSLKKTIKALKLFFYTSIKVNSPRLLELL